MSQWELALADAFDYVKTIPDGTVDAFISDLPYGTTQLKWDKVPDLERLWQEIYRVCKPSAVQVMFGAQPFVTDLINSNRKRFRYERIWEKTSPSGFLDANRRPLKMHENIIVFSAAGETTYNPQKEWVGVRAGSTLRKKDGNRAQQYGAHNSVDTPWKDEGWRYPTTIMRFSSVNKQKSLHFTQKPLELLIDLVLTYTNPGDTVLDLFAGSGTTLHACVLTGRKAIACEIDPTYHETATKRLQAVSANQMLFAPKT